MLSMIQNWQGQAEVNGVMYDNVRSIPTLPAGSAISIKLYPKTVSAKVRKSAEPVVETDSKKEIRITVKQYMTKKSEPGFDFMAKWNNDNPMPLRTMQGWIEKETKGMVYMHLHGQGEAIVTCMRCGRPLTNPISRHYGIGPECIQKIGIVAAIEDVESIKEQLVNVTWTGWVIKSAITEQEEV